MQFLQRSESFVLTKSFNFQKLKDDNKIKIEKNYNLFKGKRSFFGGEHVPRKPGGKTKFAHVLFIDIARLY